MRSKRRRRWKWHRPLLYAALRGVQVVVRRLPLGWASSFGAWSGRVAFWLLPHERKKAIRHLTWVFEKEKSAEEIRRLAKQTFIHLGRNFGEWLKIPALSDEEIITRVAPENLERVEEALRRGKGALLLTGHFGNWEWLAAYFGARGYQGGVVARRIHFEPYNRLLVGLRLSHHVKTFYRDESPREILKKLARNGVLGILPDQDVDKIDGVFIPFFGREAYTPTAPVALALASGAALVPIFLVRDGNIFRLKVEEPIPVRRSGNKSEDLRRHTLEWNAVLEKYIRQYPDQWVWMHRRWKTQPEQSRLATRDNEKVYE